MSTEVELAPKPRNHNFRKQVPKDHRQSLDTRIRWLWNQRFGTVQEVWRSTPDILDRTAATLIIQAIWRGDLDSIILLFKRLEGGSLQDTEVVERERLRV